MRKDDNTQDMFGYNGLSSDDLDKIDQEETQKHWPELLLQVHEVLRRELRAANIDEDVALVQLEALCESIGGIYTYFPRGDILKAEIRAYRVWKDFNGRNIPELSKKYRLTVPRIYQILARMRKREHEKKQYSLL